MKGVLHTSVMPSAECCTNHGLVRCKLKLQIHTQTQEERKFRNEAQLRHPTPGGRADKVSS